MRRIESISRAKYHDPNFLWKEWADIVESFTRRDLTLASDRLPALSGLASSFSPLWGCAYYAGLWEKKLLDGLGWHVYEPWTSAINEGYAPSWSWASVIGAVAWDTHDSAADDRMKEHPVDSTNILGCKATPSSEAVPFGQVADWSLTMEGCAQWIHWDGQEQIEAKGLDPNLHPPKSLTLGSPLYPEGIVARALLDYSQLQVISKTGKIVWGGLSPDNEQGVTFYLGAEEAETNDFTLPVMVIVIGRETTLMLRAIDDDRYIRVGILQFQDDIGLSKNFEGCGARIVTII
ncbi:MAG: hypothetical protein Q9169_007556 [Polycauliona sp. 2 TL-2023]